MPDIAFCAFAFQPTVIASAVLACCMALVGAWVGSRMEDGVLLDVKTEDSGRLIGRQGQTLADLQYIANRLLFQQDPAAPKIMVDVGGYRAQAREALVKKAKDAAEKVVALAR